MVDRRREFQIGLMVIGATAALFVLAILFAKDDLPFFSQRGDALPPILFDTAPGITPGSPVYKGGVLIGRVEDVELIEESSRVKVSIQLDRGFTVYTHERCRLVRDLLGDSRIEFTMTEPEGEPVEVKPDGDPIIGESAVDPMEFVGRLEGDITRAVTSVANAGEKMEVVLDKVNIILGSEDSQSMQVRMQQIDHLLATTSEAMDSFNTLAQAMEYVIGDPEVQTNMRQALIDLPATMQNISSAIETASTSMEEIGAITGPFAQRAEGMAANLDASAAKLDLIADNVLLFTEALAGGEGTIGRLVNDPEMYDRLNRTARNVEQLTVEVMPILADARVLMSELRNNPSQLGLGGLMGSGGGSTPQNGYIAPPVYDNRRPRGSWDSPTMNPPAPASPPHNSSYPQTMNPYGASASPPYPSGTGTGTVASPTYVPPPMTASTAGTGDGWIPAPR